MLILHHGLEVAMATPEGGGGGDRPYVVVNCAVSADGKLALPDRSQVEISSEEDMLRVHQLRASCDAILVGVSTIVSDDPKLYISPERVPDPPELVKVVLDASGRTPPHARFLTTPGRALVATVEGAAPALRERLGDRADVVAFGHGDLVDVTRLMGHLHDMGVGRLMVEGGGETIWSFFSSGLVDELSVFVGPMVIGGDSAPTIADGVGAQGLEELVRLELMSAERLGNGLWIRYMVPGRS
jgi:2,5-diamino-6-(ribosylamino)-4(3H)-pyrimidinone 5'-phosphate reductase